MKKLLLITCMLLLSVIYVVAQTPTQQTGTPPATENQQTQTTQDQNQQDQGTAGTTADQAGQTGTDTEAAGQLPQTASPLPLLALLGIGSLAAGYASRRK